MPHDPLEAHAGAGLAGAEVLGLRQGRGVRDGSGINLETEAIRKWISVGTQAQSDSDSGMFQTLSPLK